MGKCRSSPQHNPLTPKVAKKKYRGFWNMKILEKEKELKVLEAKASEMRSEVKQMKSADRKSKAKLRKLERINAETREANRQASINNARNQLCIQALLPLLDGNR